MPERQRHGFAQWGLALEALAWLALAAAALRLWRFEALARWASSGSPPAAGDTDGAEARRIAWAVTAASRRAPWPTACLAEGLACHAMLRRRGLPSRLYFGARGRGSYAPEAHVWVCSGEVGLVGAATADRFALLAAFPPLAPSEDG
jgi:hypothetical protein